MAKPADMLTELANALAARVETAKNAVVAVRAREARHLTGLVWQPGIVVVSEQALPRKDEFELVAPGGSILAAQVAGRDPSTNIAILKTAEPLVAPALAAADAHVGAVALAIGADGVGGASARLGIVNLAGGEWHSRRGGLIERRIVLDITLAHCEEGGPVFDAAGACRACRRSGRAVRSSSFPTRPLRVWCRNSSRTAISHAAGSGSHCMPSRSPMRCARALTKPAG